MTRLCIVDLDGVVCDNTKRFEKAEKMRSRFRAGLESMFSFELDNPVNQAYVRKGLEDLLENLFWQEAFNPASVVLDTLIEGVSEALDKLYGEYGVIFLTSRPESMRGATEAWLEQHDISVEHPQFGDFLVMKQPAFQYVKTVTWKAGMVQMLHRLFDADTVVFVDDEENNRRAVLDAYPDGGDFGMVRVYGSLAETVAALQKEVSL